MKQTREHLDIMVLKQETRRLAAVEATWTTRDPEDRVAFRAEWHDLMDVFGEAVAASDAGRLDEADEQDLREVARSLADAVSHMDRLRLRRPDPEALARTKLTAAR
jgi:hypothetical protein